MHLIKILIAYFAYCIKQYLNVSSIKKKQLVTAAVNFVKELKQYGVFHIAS